MGNNKKAKNDRRRELRLQIRAKATEVLELWSTLAVRFADVEHFTQETALLNSPALNYYEKLQMYLIQKHATECLHKPIADHEDSQATLERHTWWLLTNAEQIQEQETEWSDKVSGLLERLHMCCLAGASQGGGACWLEYESDDPTSPFYEAIRQLEDDGLIFRKQRMYKSTRHRWPALELQTQAEQFEGSEDSEAEDEEVGDSSEEGPALLGSKEEADKAHFQLMTDEELAEQLQAAGEASKDAAAASDFYAAAAADGVSFCIEQEMQRRQAEQEAASMKLEAQMQALCTMFKDQAFSWSKAKAPGQKHKVPASHLFALQGILRSVLKAQLPSLSSTLPAPHSMSSSANVPPAQPVSLPGSEDARSRQGVLPPSTTGRQEADPNGGQQLLRMLREWGMSPDQAQEQQQQQQRQQQQQQEQQQQQQQGGATRVSGVRTLAEVERRTPESHRWPSLGEVHSGGGAQPAPPAQPAAPGSLATGSKMAAPPADWEPVFACPPPPPRITQSMVRSRAVDVRCALENLVIGARGMARQRARSCGITHMFRDALKMDARSGVYLKVKLWQLWKQTSHWCHHDTFHANASQEQLSKEIEHFTAQESWLFEHVLPALETAEAFGLREAYVAAENTRAVAIEETCGEVLQTLDMLGGTAERSVLQLQLLANETLTNGRSETANSLLFTALQQLSQDDIVIFLHTSCREQVRLRPFLRNLSLIHMASNVS